MLRTFTLALLVASVLARDLPGEPSQLSIPLPEGAAPPPSYHIASPQMEVGVLCAGFFRSSGPLGFVTRTPPAGLLVLVGDNSIQS